MDSHLAEIVEFMRGAIENDPNLEGQQWRAAKEALDAFGGPDVAYKALQALGPRAFYDAFTQSLTPERRLFYRGPTLAPGNVLNAQPGPGRGVQGDAGYDPMGVLFGVDGFGMVRFGDFTSAIARAHSDQFRAGAAVLNQRADFWRALSRKIRGTVERSYTPAQAAALLQQVRDIE